VADSTPQKEKSKLSGLKRLGTVVNRRKSTAPPMPTPKEEKRRTRFVPFRRGESSRSFQDLEESGQDLTPTATQERPQSSVSQDRRHELPGRDSPEPPLPQTNGFAQPQTTTPLNSNPTQEATPPIRQDTLSPPPVGSNNPYQQMAISQAATADTNSSIQQTQNALSEAAASPQVSSPVDDSARNFMIRDKPIEEDQSEAQQAMNNMANQLRSQGISRPMGSVRGRRDVRNTIYVPASTEALPQQSRQPPPVSIPEDSTSAPENMVASPLQRPPPIAAVENHTTGSDAASMHSSRSLATATHHPDLHESGLNVSLIETVHSTFTQTGISESFVLGEIAMSYNPSDLVSDTETIRITSFELLDKVAANPIFLAAPKPSAESTEEQAGTYLVSTTQLRRPTPMICLKYQLHMEETNLARYSPLLITPAWQIIEGQVSVIVLYSLNPVFNTASSSDPIILRNVAISVNLDVSDPTAGKAASAQMAPTQGASFKRKSSTVTWRMSEFSVTTTQERLLVRFQTTGGLAKKGLVDVKFELLGRTASGVGVERLIIGGSGKEKEIDPFADSGSGEGDTYATDESSKKWGVVKGRGKVVSGRYIAS
jgi:F-BAR domain only protein